MKKKKYIVFLLFIFLSVVVSCRKKAEDQKVKVDFSKRAEIIHFTNGTGPPLKAAVAAMTSPEDNFLYYNRIFDYLSEQTGRRIIFKQRKTYQEVNDLLRYKELDFAFICSGAYVEAKRDFNVEILAAPQIEGKTKYFAYIIVRKDSGFESLSDLKEKKFGFTDPLSNTGCLYPHFLLAKMGLSAEEFFYDIVYTYAHDNSIQAVANRIVDGASVDSLIFDSLQNGHPEKVSRLKVIMKSPPFGMPPVVVHPDINPELKEKIRQGLLNMDQDKKGKEILSQLGIDCFVAYRDSEYDSIRGMISVLKMFQDEN